MAEFAERLSPDSTLPLIAAKQNRSASAFRRRLGLLKWLAPASLVFLVVVYELGPSRWIHNRLGADYHFVVEILVYGTAGPALAFLVLHLLDQWLQERETTELQALVLAHARERVRISRELNDDALQILFAASTLLATLKTAASDLPPETAAALRETEQALSNAIQQLRDHLQTWPRPDDVS